jgi:hypothetical protein
VCAREETKNELVSGGGGRGPLTFYFALFLLCYRFYFHSLYALTRKKKKKKRQEEKETYYFTRARVGRIWKFVRTPKICRAPSLIISSSLRQWAVVVTGGNPDLLLLLISHRTSEMNIYFDARAATSFGPPVVQPYDIILRVRQKC